MGSLPAILGLVVLFVVFSSLNDRFLTTYNMANLVIQAGSIIVLAMGIVFVLLLGEIDLSAGVAGGASRDDHRPDADRLRLDVVGWPRWPASPCGAVIGLAIGVARVASSASRRSSSPSPSSSRCRPCPLKLIGSGGSLRFNDEVLRGLSIKNVPVTAGWIAAVLIVVGFAALSLWRYRSLSAKGLVHQPLGLVVIQIAVLAVDRARPHRPAQRRTARPTPTSSTSAASRGCCRS